MTETTYDHDTYEGGTYDRLRQDCLRQDCLLSEQWRHTVTILEIIEAPLHSAWPLQSEHSSGNLPSMLPSMDKSLPA